MPLLCELFLESDYFLQTREVELAEGKVCKLSLSLSNNSDPGEYIIVKVADTSQFLIKSTYNIRAIII